MNIYDILYDKRLELKKSIREVANDLNTDIMSISKVENGDVQGDYMYELFERLLVYYGFKNPMQEKVDVTKNYR